MRSLAYTVGEVSGPSFQRCHFSMHLPKDATYILVIALTFSPLPRTVYLLGSKQTVLIKRI
jgi:hypothetical protein